VGEEDEASGSHLATFYQGHVNRSVYVLAVANGEDRVNALHAMVGVVNAVVQDEVL